MRQSTVLIVALILTLGCGGPEMATKQDMERLKAEEEKTRQMQAEKEKKEQELKALQSERDKKQAEARDEKMKVRKQLKKMGMAAEFVEVSMTGNGGAFLYPGGKMANIVERVSSPDLLQQLNTMLDKQAETDNEDRALLNACQGAYETCLNGRLYIGKLKLDGGACSRVWYWTDGSCD